MAKGKKEAPVLSEIFMVDAVELKPGDLLVIFSDGITEAFDEGDQQFGDERLAGVISEHRDEPAESIIRHIVDAVNKYAGRAPQADDLTLVVIKRDAK